MLPSRVTLSRVVTDKFRNLKGLTGLTPNILARVSIMLALRDGSSLKNASVADTEGQVLNRDVLFGEYADVYDVLIRQYATKIGIEEIDADFIAALVEAGAHKIGHLKNVSDIAHLYDDA